jgi:hypothetical protein
MEWYMTTFSPGANSAWLWAEPLDAEVKGYRNPAEMHHRRMGNVALAWLPPMLGDIIDCM